MRSMEEKARYDRDFKGVWIPREIWLSEHLSLVEKALFVEIQSLDNERGCYASNAHFAKFFGVSIRQIIRYIASLKQHGFVIVQVRNKNERTIRTAGKYRRVSDAEIRSLRQQGSDLVRKMTAFKSSRG